VIHYVGAKSFAQAHMCVTMWCRDSIVYWINKIHTIFSGVLRLMNLKAINGWTDKSFTKLLVLLKYMLLKGNILSNNNYKAMKILYSMGRNIKIYMHVVMIAYYIQKNLNGWRNIQSVGYHVIRWKTKMKIIIVECQKMALPVKVVWYLLIISRLRHCLQT